jgi:mono/diheme cytochrome c family protein
MKRYVFTLTLVIGTSCLAGGQVQVEPAGKGEPPAGAGAVNFSEHIAPIVYGHCASCHRPGEVGPFSLLTYADVRKRGKLIVQLTQSRAMPPWHPEPGHGDFRNERRLTDAQVATIKRWVETGMPEGDPGRLPKKPAFPEGWQLGKPDLVVSMDKPFRVPATGPDIYRNFVLPLNLKEDTWVKAIELRPSARSVVHHVLYFVDTTGRARARDGQGGKPGYSGSAFSLGQRGVGGWAAGRTPEFLPLDLAYHFPKGSDLILQTHFHPSGKVEEEKTTVGLYFAKKKPERTHVVFQAPPFFGIAAGINIPAGTKDYKLRGRFNVPVDIELVTIHAHAHYICETVKAKATLPDGKTVSLLSIPKWDFNWQDSYTYKTPVPLPRGTVISVEMTYNNSADNPANPFSPPKRIRWGTKSTDEMGSVIFGCIAARESDVSTLRQSTPRLPLRIRPKADE